MGQTIQSNSTCAPIPKDKRQLVCTCGKQLQLRCTFNVDIREIEPKDLDRALKPIYYKDVSITRTENPDDPDDINKNFRSKKLDKLYLYFPNFDILSSPFIRITFVRFLFIPSFSFFDKLALPTSTSLQSSRAESSLPPVKYIPSLVFELQEVFDFGIDRFAFFNVHSDSLIIEGPFNEMTIHQDAFVNTRVDELTIGCYCLECETFQGDCRLKFNQKSARETYPYTKNFLGAESNATSIKRMKFFGVEFDVSGVWNLDLLPGLTELTYLEISNMFSRPARVDEFRATLKVDKLAELHLKNSGIKKLSKKMLGIFGSLRVLNLAQNSIDRIDDDTFVNNIVLEELNLERNSMKKLTPFVSTLEKLTVLNLKDNQIASIDDNTFYNMKALRVLDLTRNQIHTLNEKTFVGLQSLRELILSYNPLRKLDVNSFRYLALNSPLSRLDLISNTESNWFVFDDADICLLAHFKCETQINIDLDQRCNCFVKYINEIGLAKRVTSRVEIQNEMSENGGFSVFRPCTESLSASGEPLPLSRRSGRNGHGVGDGLWVE